MNQIKASEIQMKFQMEQKIASKFQNRHKKSDKNRFSMDFDGV